MKNILLGFILCFSFNSMAQFTLLQDIWQDQYLGVGQSFKGYKVGEKLYFSGTYDNYYFNLWESDGTVSGTQLAVTETEIDQLVFGTSTDEGLYLKDGNKFKYLNASDNSLTTIEYFNGTNISRVYNVGDNLLIRSGNTLYGSDGTTNGSYEIGDFDGGISFLHFTTNDDLAVISYTNSFANFVPFIIENDLATITTIKDYIAPYREVNKVIHAYLYNNLLMMQVDEPGSSQSNLIMDINTKEFSSFPYVKPLIAGYEKDGKSIILTETNLISVDPNTLESTILFDDVAPFSDFQIHNGNIYFMTFSWESDYDRYNVSDGTIEGTYELEGANVGPNIVYQSSAILNNKLYFIKAVIENTSDYTYHLMEHNIATNTTEDKGRIREHTGSLTITPKMFVINNKLVLSKHTLELGHELYVADFTSSINKLNRLKHISIKSNLISTNLEIEGLKINSEATIIDLSGKVYIKHLISNTDSIIPIEKLSFGSYFITIHNKNGIISIPFVKI